MKAFRVTKKNRLCLLEEDELKHPLDIRIFYTGGKMFDLDGIVVSEHSAHLYFNRENYGQCLQYLEGGKLV